MVNSILELCDKYIMYVVILFLEHLHSVPVARMGNYHEYLAKVPQPLRKIDTLPERLHTFGNPFKVNKVLYLYHCSATHRKAFSIKFCSSEKNRGCY